MLWGELRVGQQVVPVALAPVTLEQVQRSVWQPQGREGLLHHELPELLRVDPWLQLSPKVARQRTRGLATL
jgi:hypothetical protein